MSKIKLIKTSKVKIIMSEFTTMLIFSGLILDDEISLVMAVCEDPDPEIDNNPLRLMKLPYIAKPAGPEKIAMSLFIKRLLITLTNVLIVVRVKTEENFNFLPSFYESFVYKNSLRSLSICSISELFPNFFHKKIFSLLLSGLKNSFFLKWLSWFISKKLKISFDVFS